MDAGKDSYLYSYFSSLVHIKFLIIHVDCFTFTQLTAVKPKMLPTSFTQGQNVVFLISFVF